jgi:Protein of unknown function (DUF3011)
VIASEVREVRNPSSSVNRGYESIEENSSLRSEWWFWAGGRLEHRLGSCGVKVRLARVTLLRPVLEETVMIRMGRWWPVLAMLLFPAAQHVRGQRIACSSDDGAKHYCAADTRYGAHLVKQTSKEPCAEGKTWGYDEGIWVDQSCRGEFTIGSPEKGDAEPAAGRTVTCASENVARKYCPVETSGNAQLVRQLSEAPCAQGTSWGFDTHGVWVNKGCSADFVVGVPKLPAPREDRAKTKSQRLMCTSDDGRRTECDFDTQGATVQLTRQLGAASCVEGSAWGA